MPSARTAPLLWRSSAVPDPLPGRQGRAAPRLLQPGAVARRAGSGALLRPIPGCSPARPGSAAQDLLSTNNNQAGTGVLQSDGPTITEKVRALAGKPNIDGVCYSGYVINNFRFHTMSHESGHVTQNSGVVNIAENGVRHYGRLSGIFELSYNDYKVVFFNCDWYDVYHEVGIQTDEFGFTLVNKSGKIHTGDELEDDPFVFSSQVQQIFFVQDPKAELWNVVVEVRPHDLFDMGAEESLDETD
ncbi:uncharacterized protein [Triticum aestivum]|uniref:uncharacterized protein isoform X1 n=1 Tax=Triticum aestivum TaxID=4565 RepID=UPI0008444B5E|nr:uncharacterized protein LOC123113987 isoform X1 [Triticum aestivum]